MTQKKIFFIIVSVCILAALVFFFLTKTPISPTKTTSSSSTQERVQQVKTTAWNPKQGVLTVTTNDKKTFQISITVPQTKVIIPVTKPGEPRSEAPLITRAGNQRWELAFCPGDTVQIVDDTINLNTLDTASIITVKELRNTGNRACAW
ncbi:MAG: hypothetical protein V1917_02520 [Candidatus Gottesmanbacteria bacterium]